MVQPPPETFDVVVVGGGGSGLSAAIAARDAGCSVLLLEKNERLGGSTAWSIGSISATRTPHQVRKGIQDSPADHWADMPLFSSEEKRSRDNDVLRQVLCEEIPETFQWLQSLGVRFYGPMPEPPHRQPRMHNVLPNSHSFIYHLGRRARAIGVDIRLGVRATRLNREDGRVAAIDTDGGDGPRRFRALRGVILAAGDFTNNPELKAQYMGVQEAKVEGLNRSATGDGQRMAIALGARILNGNLALGPQIRFVAPDRPTFLRRLPPSKLLSLMMKWALDYLPPSLLRPLAMGFLTTALAPSPALFEHGALLLNKKGERFCDETANPAYALPDQPDKIGFILIDSRLARRFSKWPDFISTAPGIAYAYIEDYRRNRRDVFTEANSLSSLAQKLGMQASSLGEAVALYNNSLPHKSISKNDEPRHSLEPPFIALGPVRSIFVHNEGGLAVDESHRVLDDANRPIAGLYAAGSTGQGGLLLDGHGHHLAWAFVSGRRAGHLITHEAQKEVLGRRDTVVADR